MPDLIAYLPISPECWRSHCDNRPYTCTILLMDDTLISLLADLPELYGVQDLQGSHASHLSDVRFFRSTQSRPRQPLVYSPGLIVIVQGHKVVYLKGREFTYGRGSYLILGVPLPLECQTFATQESPVLGVFIDLSAARIRRILGAMQDSQDEGESCDHACLGVEPAALDASMKAATARLLRCLRDATDARVLGEAIVDEMIYRALQGPHGQPLRQLAAQQSNFARVAKVLDYVHTHYAEPIAVESLARQSAMSTSSFFKTFSDVTGDSPLQYIKKIRLDKALNLLLLDQRPVSDVAYQVGYESPSQFSREFKRHFSVSPKAVRQDEAAWG